MREVIEHYGLALLGMLSTVFVFMIIFKSYKAGGVLSQVISNYFIILCG